jgi:isocitrate dehydrogenase
LRWDSLGEYCALVPSLEMIAENSGNAQARVLANALDAAISTYLENGKAPSRKVNEIDNRGSSFYLTMYWAEALANQTESGDIAKAFAVIAGELRDNEAQIAKELLESQGEPVDIGGYFMPDDVKAEEAMRPSGTLNKIINSI